MKDSTMRPSPASFVIEHALMEPAGEPTATEMTAAFLIAAPEQRPVILAIAPQAEDQLAFELRLHASGYEVYTASTASEALDLAEHLPLDVIVLDLDGDYATGRDNLMISGFRLLYLLRRVIGERPVALMVVTACDYAEIEGAVCAHADALVNKPVSPGQLIARLCAALERVRSRCRHRLVLPQPWRPAGGSGLGQG
jgi:DNA-binding response OmpR family regulator